jgi:hypothetical protein
MNASLGSIPCLFQRVLALLLPALAATLPAQVAPAPATASTAASGEIVELSPFQVNASQDRGYQASSALSGTRLNSRLEDLAASITVVTKQQLLDAAAVDLNDIFLNEANTEGIYQYTEWQQDRGYTIDVVAQNPQIANRVRGLGTANTAIGNFASSSAIPIDTYNVDAVEISRGPNSNIFGLGEASGTVNLIPSQANLTREFFSFTARADSSGGWRTSFDLNRPILRSRVDRRGLLAVRLAGVYEDKEFERKPSRDKTNRLTASLTFRPFKKTTLRAAYESYHNYNSRANSTTPRDSITEWRAVGSPVWDPTTSSWRLLSGTTYTQVLPANEAAQLPRGINPNFTSFWNRPSVFIDQGRIAFYTVNRSANAPTGTQVANPGLANSNTRYMQNGTLIQRGGGAFGVVSLPLFQAPGITNQALYDWESINIAAPNFGRQKADIYRLELEQWFLDTPTHRLALQAGFMREDITKMSRNFIGASDGAPPVVQIDINEKLLDGRPNPYFLRPYIGGSEMQTFRYPELNDNSKATLAYQLDLRRSGRFLQWLGWHSFAAYGEFREMTFAPQGLRYRDKIVSDHPWMTAANLTNIPGRGAETNLYTRYYLGDPVTNAGAVVDAAPTRPLQPGGTYPLTWFNSTTNQWVNENVTLDEVYFALGQQQRQIRTRGLIWQGYFLEDRLIPTLGWRRDKNRSVGNVTVPLDPATRRFDLSYLDQFGTNWTENQGPTKTQGAVLKPLRNLGFLERQRTGGSGLVRFLADTANSLAVHYNKSDSFTPAPLAYSLYGDVLPNPTGRGKDYGASLSFFSGKLSVRFNKYETLQKAARNGATAVLATRPLRLDFDTSGANAVFGIIGGDSQDLEDNATTWVTSIHPTWTVAQQEAEVYRILGLTKAFVDRIKNLPAISDINNVISRGLEMELNYNPTRYWTLKGTVTKQRAVDQDLSPLIQQYVNERMPIWTSVRIPTDRLPDGTQLQNAGQRWWDFGAPGATGTSVPSTFYSANVDAPYALAVTNAGKPRPQTRQWRWSATTSYQLAGLVGDNRYLRNFTVGGSVRWEDKAIVGFLGAAPDADGVVRRLDGNKPIYDKSRYYADLLVSYGNLRFFNDKVRARLQLNVRNILEDGRLQKISFNPDGTAWNFRIIDPRQFIVSATFDL